MKPGDNCPECDRRLSSDQCVCGWRAAAAQAGPRKCERCPSQDNTVRFQDGRHLCGTCRADLMRINAASDDDVTESGETVAQLKARCRELLAANSYKWESKREGVKSSPLSL